MMDFMDSLRRGVDRAGFEVDRLLRANRVRSQINTLQSDMDEEMRQAGRRAMELFDRGLLAQEELLEYCERIKQCQSELAEREAELEAINREAPPVVGPEPGGPAPAASPPQPDGLHCPNCGAEVREDADFCHRCGANLKAAAPTPPAPPEQPAS